MKKHIFLTGVIISIMFISGCIQQKEINDNSVNIKNEKISLKCSSDDDCMLINKDLGFSCCWDGACEAIDYALDKYIAMNKESFLELGNKNCPWAEDKVKRYQECGPPPECPVQGVNDNFVAKCVNNMCIKISK